MSAARTNDERASASEYTATVRIPMRAHVRITRSAISPRFATRTDENAGHPLAEGITGDPEPDVPNRYIRKTPNGVSGIGALSAADSPSARTIRVSTGSITPSSHSRAVEKYGDPSRS